MYNFPPHAGLVAHYLQSLLLAVREDEKTSMPIENRRSFHPHGVSRLTQSGVSRLWAVLAVVLPLVLNANASRGDDVSTAPEGPRTLTVYKAPTCTCCRPWILYMESEGFSVNVVELDSNPASRDASKQEHGVPEHLRSCHTSVIDGYVIEGHVGADDVRKLLREKPPIKGLFVAGMPHGAPGMEGGEPVRYEVIALNANGEERVYSVHEPAPEDHTDPGPPAATGHAR